MWIIVLGRLDIAYATFTISKFNMLPREEHLKAVKRIRWVSKRQKTVKTSTNDSELVASMIATEFILDLDTCFGHWEWHWMGQH
jgi:hypothetical protein